MEPMERLNKIIARFGICSRRAAEQLLLDGKVSVNGMTVTDVGGKADPTQDRIKVNDQIIGGKSFNAKHVYILLNKPKEYITSVRDPEGRPTVMELLPRLRCRVYPVGRLDYDSEGLLLFTNDGDLAHRLMHPRMEIQKTYWVKVKGKITEEKIKKIEAGNISLATGKTAPCQIRKLGERVENSWIEIKLHEGKKREIRRMMLKMGHPVTKLKRVAYAFLKIGSLATGMCRYLTAKEVSDLQKLAGTGETEIGKMGATERPKKRLQQERK